MAGVKLDQGRALRVQLVEFLRTYQRKHGYLPSINEMSAELGISRTASVWHLASLRSQGYVTYVDGDTPRTLRLVPGRQTRKLE